MAADERWYFTKEQLQSSPSRKCGIDADKELSYRQQAANFIQDMGQRLPVNQLCINTAIVYMHRFYMFHSFTKFHRNAISTCALFLAAKVEEQPRKLEHVIKVAHMCLNKGPSMDTKTEAYLEQAQQLVMNENIMLQTLGFDVAIDHPHTHIVKCCQLVRASKDLAQTSYIMATNSLHLTTMCLQYKPTIVACVCIHLACKWASWEIPYSSEGKDWFWYVEKYITLELLEDLTAEFLAILDKCPSRLNKRKILNASKEMVSDKKGKIDANCYDIPLSLLAPTSEKNRSPMLKQEKNDRPERIDRMKAERFDRVDRNDKNDWAESSTSDKLDRSEKQNRTERQVDKMIKLERTERFERHERLEKSEKEKHDRTVERERSDRQLKPSKIDHPIRIEHSDKVNESKEMKGEPVASCHSTSSESHHVNVASMQNPLKLPGIIPSTTDSKSSASGDGSNIPVPGVSKKHRYNASKQSSSKEHREHKDRREKEQAIDKERQSQLSNFHAVQSKTPPPQPLIRQEKGRHRKEEVPVVKLTDIANVNNQCDVRAPSLSSLNITQEKLKDTSIKNQMTHQNEYKHSEIKQRTKHSTCTYEKNVVLNEIKSESLSEEEKVANSATSNEMKKIKTVTPEGKMNSSMVKSEKSSMHPRINQQFLSQDKHLQEVINKSSEPPPAALPLNYVHSHPQQMPAQISVTLTSTEKPNIMPEKHERHERKEKHKHKDRDREKIKEKREAMATEGQELQASSAQVASSVTSQRIKLTIPKERLNSKSINSSESSRKKSSPPKDMTLKLKISKEMLTAAPAQKKTNDIPKLKIKIPKDPALYSNKSSEKTESRKRERDSSPKNLNLKNSPKSPKIPRIETRSSRKDDGVSTQSLLSLPMPPEPVATNSRSSKSETSSKTNGSNTSAGGSSFPHFSRKSGSSSKVNDNYKNKSSHVMPTAYQQIQMNAGPYPYAQYYPYPSPMSGYFPHPPPPTGDFHSFYGQNFHMGPPLPPPPPDHGPPPLPREPPPPTPPPPPE